MRELVVDLRRMVRQPVSMKVEDPAVQTASPWPGRLAWAGLFLLALVAAVAIVREWRPLTVVPAAPEMRLEIITPPTADATSLAISRDGQKIVFAGTSQGQSRLWLLMAVPIRLPSKGQAMEIGTPIPLFPARVMGGALSTS